MPIFSELLFIPLQAIASLWVAMLIIRAWASFVQAPMRQPLGEFIMRLTDFAVLPLRRLLKPSSRMDWACVSLGYAAALLYVLLAALLFAGFMAPGSLLWAAFITHLRWGLYTFMGVLVAQAVLSWTQGNPAAASFLHRLTEPMLAPLRRVVPMAGPVDLSPLVLILAAQMALAVVNRLAVVF